jgi:acylphosphatase
MPTDLIRQHVFVTGRVQGVFFRETLRRRAETRGVAGWVQNNADGSVEAVFEGPETSVINMLVFMKEGSHQAEVRTMSTSREEAEGLSGFAVR